MDQPVDEPDTGPKATQIPPEAPPRQIGIEAEALDRKQTALERMRLPRPVLRRFALLGVLYVVLVGGLALTFDSGPRRLSLVPVVVVLAFAFQTADSAAGMGFGTGLAPLLFVLGYEPLQIVPVLLLSQTLMGLVAGAVHHDIDNVTFSLRPLNDETKLLFLLVGIGSVAVLGSVVLTYFTLELSDVIIESYVSFLVLTMGVVGLLRARLRTRIEYRPRRLAAFALLAGVNKGIGGGGYGPVVTLGQILSGVYEKSAVAITTLAEGIVSITGIATFFILFSYGVPVDLQLLPSIFAGGFLAAIVGPYAVRVVPNSVWRYLIPIYAFGIGLIGLLFGVDV
ncbi:sulfite exporter TauE/SafE family protein [Natronorubrum aibiense]|uniref:Probable membrane transporter protein n=1 Tax=Natronorubrum aibiense TaxID=348826 RepID=A0A5P9P115_9EURY|nr:sulfite exporter TauE/SafE family protein [Natronorubrum aibiense]QFU81787.1 TSUP family transporter [Natronorubrum aibiense]